MNRNLLASILALVVLAIAACSPSNVDTAAPDFSLPDAAERQVELARLLQENDAVVLVFYRGFF